MLRYKIINEAGYVGALEYHEETQELHISFPVREDVAEIRKFFDQKRDFEVPEADKDPDIIDGDPIVTAYPTENQEFFERRLSELYGATNIKVDW